MLRTFSRAVGVVGIGVSIARFFGKDFMIL